MRPHAQRDETASTPAAEAYDLFLRGEYFLNRRTEADIETAVSYFQHATQRDPDFARAWAALADAEVLHAVYSIQPPQALVSQARAAALKALELDPSLAEAHAALALIVQNHDWDWQTAEREFRQAIALNPNYATAHHWYAEHLMWRGRFDEALRESERRESSIRSRSSSRPTTGRSYTSRASTIAPSRNCDRCSPSTPI